MTRPAPLPRTPTWPCWWVRGGSPAGVMATGLEVVASDPQVRAILVNVFGGITSCDTVAQGIVTAVESLGGLPKPVVVRLDGNNADTGRAILAAPRPRRRGLRPPCQRGGR